MPLIIGNQKWWYPTAHDFGSGVNGIAMINIQAPATSGQVSYTTSDLQGAIPKAAYFTGNSATADMTQTTDIACRTCHGVAVGTSAAEQYTYDITADWGEGTHPGQRFGRGNEACYALHLYDGEGESGTSLLCRATLVSFDVNGLTLDWELGTGGGASYYVSIVLCAGDDLNVAYRRIDDIYNLFPVTGSPSSTGSLASDVLTFEPDCIWAINKGGTTAIGDSHCSMAFGITNKQTVANMPGGAGGNNIYSNMSADWGCRDSRMMNLSTFQYAGLPYSFSDANESNAYAYNMDSDGYITYCTAVPAYMGSMSRFELALGWGGAAKVSQIVMAGNGSTGNQNYAPEDTSFTPAFVYSCSAGHSDQTAYWINRSAGRALFTPTVQAGYMSYRKYFELSAYNSTNMWDKMSTSGEISYAHERNFVSMNSGSMTLNNVTAPSANGTAFAIGFP